MTPHALIVGSLFRRPEQRLSKAGKFFTTATIKVIAGTGFQFWNAIAFSEAAQSELLRLEEGDSVSASGAFRAEIRDHAGEKRVSFSLTVEGVLALRPPPKPQEKHDAKPRPSKQPARPAPFDDEIGF